MDTHIIIFISTMVGIMLGMVAMAIYTARNIEDAYDAGFDAGVRFGRLTSECDKIWSEIEEET